MAEPSDHADRLQRLEESHGFLEHSLEELSAEVRMLSARLHDLNVRLARLQARLDTPADPESAPSDQQ